MIRMNPLLPDGYLSLQAAIRMLAAVLYAGTATSPQITRLHKHGYQFGSSDEYAEATEQLWSAVDAGKLQLLAVGGVHRQIIALPPDTSQWIPLLRSPQGRGLTYLRPNNPAHRQFVEWFGADVSRVTLAFRETQLSTLSRLLVRRRRRITKRVAEGTRSRGRPSLQDEIRPIVREVVEARQWTPLKSIKTLTSCVNRRRRSGQPVSDETVTRTLDSLFKETQNRQFERPRRRARRK